MPYTTAFATHTRTPRANLPVPLFFTYRFRQRIHVTLASYMFSRRRRWRRQHHLSASRDLHIPGDDRILWREIGERADDDDDVGDES